MTKTKKIPKNAGFLQVFNFKIPNLFPIFKTIIPNQLTAQLHTQLECLHGMLIWTRSGNSFKVNKHCIFLSSSIIRHPDFFLNCPSAGYLLTTIMKFPNFPRPLDKNAISPKPSWVPQFSQTFLHFYRLYEPCNFKSTSDQTKSLEKGKATVRHTDIDSDLLSVLPFLIIFYLRLFM